MTVTKCRSCGREIVFAHTESGQLMPVDVKPTTVWKLREVDGETYVDRVLADEQVHISHFASCPNAASFSQRARSRS